MRKFGALALVFLLGGCLSAPEESLKKEPSAAALKAPELPDTVAEALSPSIELNASAAVFEFGESPSSIDGSPLALEDAAPEEGTVDEETLEDNRLLSEENMAPPEDEGETVAPEEVTFDFPVVENEKVRYYIEHYSGPGKRTFGRWLERSGRYIPLMRQIFKEEGLPQDLAYLALVESGFNNRAYSWAHAVGPWQFIESTGKLFGLQNDWWLDERRDFEKSTRAAAKFLRDLHKSFDGNWYLAVASYNAGGGKIRKAIRKYNTRDFWELSRGKFLKAETKAYVPKLLAALFIAKEPGKYGFADLEYLPPLEFDVVKVPTATDLDVVAGLCDVPYDEIKNLNPELKRWCTPPEIKDYRLRIPAGKQAFFHEKYAQLPVAERANYKRHRIKRGDTLRELANRFDIRVADIVALNDIKNPRALQIGKDLILPLKEGYSRLPLEELKDDYQRSRRRTYTVRSGDSLWKIARRFGVTEKDLRVWNRLGWSNIIRPGQELVVSGKSSSTRKVARKKQDPLRKIVYKVRPGDTLWGIGRQFEVATKNIMSWNNLSSDHVLHPGDKLTLLVRGGHRG